MEDPHQMYPPNWSFYAFFILAPILIAVVFYVGAKLMTYLEKRENEKLRRQDKNSEER